MGFLDAARRGERRRAGHGFIQYQRCRREMPAILFGGTRSTAPYAPHTICRRHARRPAGDFKPIRCLCTASSPARVATASHFARGRLASPRCAHIGDIAGRRGAAAESGAISSLPRCFPSTIYLHRMACIFAARWSKIAAPKEA